MGPNQAIEWGQIRPANSLVPPAPPSTITLSQAQRTFPTQGAIDGHFSVYAPPGTAWAASTLASWITITSGAGTGNGFVSYTVAANGTTAPRTASIVVGTAIHTVDQLAAGTASSPSITSFTTVPASRNTADGTIEVTAFDLNGEATISDVRTLLSTDPFGVPSCLVRYNRPLNRFYLSASGGTETQLAGANIENAFCVLKAAGTVMTPLDGTSFRIAISLSFKSTFAGSHKITTHVQDNGGLAASYDHDPPWIVPGTVNVSVWGSRSNAERNGIVTLNAAVVNTSNPNVTWSITPSTAGSFDGTNPTTAVFRMASNVVAGTVAIVRATSVVDPTRWGEWHILNKSPNVLSVTPSSGSGNGPQLFDFRFDDDALSDVAHLEALFWNEITNDGCHVQYDRATGVVHAYGEIGGSALLSPGSPDIISTYCRVIVSESSVTHNGSNISFKLKVQFTGPPRQAAIYGKITDNGEHPAEVLQSFGFWQIP